MDTKTIIAKAIFDALELVANLVRAGDDRAAAEEALMRQAERNKARLDELKFGGGG